MNGRLQGGEGCAQQKGKPVNYRHRTKSRSLKCLIEDPVVESAKSPEIASSESPMECSSTMTCATPACDKGGTKLCGLLH